MDQKKKIPHIFLYLLILCTGIVWGFSFLGTKIALEHLTPIEVLATRWLLGAVVIVVLAQLKVIKINLKEKPLRPLLIIALFQPAIYSIAECVGIGLTTVSESSIFIATIPTFVVIISTIFFNKKISLITVFAILLAFLGVVATVVLSPSFSISGKWSGYLCMLLAVVMGAAYSAKCGSVAGKYTPMEITYVMAIVGAVWFNVLSLVLGNGVKAYTMQLHSPALLGAILFLGLGCTAFCYVGYNTAMTNLPAHQAAMLQSNTTTVVGLLSGILISGDPCGWYTFVGLALIIIGIVTINLQEGRLAKLSENTAKSDIA
ncbi:MAG: DMT family transporter [Firmicutes bacterium]|nr:DMT family transporter [Bacillota bacterium]